jgi:hypothetical protein
MCRLEQGLDDGPGLRRRRHIQDEPVRAPVNLELEERAALLLLLSQAYDLGLKAGRLVELQP